MRPKILDVVENDLCIACGACVEACPEKIVVPAFNAKRGAEEVALSSDGAECVGCPAHCDDVCPSIEVDFRQQENFPDVKDGSRFGPVLRASIGYAEAHRDNGVSSSGGIVRALIYDAVRRGESVVCLGEDGEGGYRPRLFSDADELTQVPGSIYQSVSFIGAIDLCRRSERGCVLVATPCQLEGIEKFVDKVEPSLREKITLRVGLICGWMFSQHTLDSFAHYKGISGAVTHAAYRGEDEKGNLKFRAEGVNHSFVRRGFENPKDESDYSASFSSILNRLRCRLCEDHLNVLADIAVGDAWLKRKDGEKTSIILCRTDPGLRRIEDLEQREVVVLEQASAVEDILESQSPALVYGTTAQQISTWLRNKGVETPRFIYRDSPGIAGQKLSWKRAALVRLEMFLRGVARRRWYRLYRFLYRLRTRVVRLVR